MLSSRRSFGRFALRPIMAACLAIYSSSSLGLPKGAVPAFGKATVEQTSATQLNIKQTSLTAGLDWSSFSIAANERVSISQPGSSSVLVNRVLGNDPSQILGKLQSNGSVWLINPRGIFFGQNSVVDVGGLLASTLSITNENMFSGRLTLSKGSGSNAGDIVSEGLITAPQGSVVMVAPQLTHSGRIEAPRVGLLAATDVQLDLEGDGLIFFNPRNDGSLQTRLNLLGSVKADGGTAEMRAVARAGFADTVLNLEGVVQARSIGKRNGSIVIDGGRSGITQVSGQLDASGAATGERGGDIRVLGDRVGLFGNATIDASGAAGGGTVLVGGALYGAGDVPTASQTVVGANARINASATDKGNGGQVVVWSDGSTTFQGSIEARGGANGGDGGFVETSGKQTLIFRGTVNTLAPKGETGTLLLDPQDIVISDDAVGVRADDAELSRVGGEGQVLFTASPSASFTISSAELERSALTNNIDLQATHSIKINNLVTHVVTPNTLTLAKTGNTGYVKFRTGAGGFSMDATNTILVTGGSLTIDASDPLATGSGPFLSVD
jgi:filamentous hemagglutinin family protein